jgi:2-polyprenyl-3-methyl-5-hydroxy-6-metoxy-1,4-benzoquinol methylase
MVLEAKNICRLLKCTLAMKKRTILSWYVINALPGIIDFIGMQMYKLKSRPFSHPIWEDRALLDLITHNFQDYEKPKLLDIGCGEGTLAIIFALLGADVEAIDISHRRLAMAMAKRRALGLQNVSFRLLDITKHLPYSNEHFDIALLYHVYEHLPNRLQVLSRIHQILRTDGKLVIAVPLVTSLKKKIAKAGICYFSDSTHEIEFTTKMLFSELHATKFSIRRKYLYGFDPLIQKLFTPLFAVFPQEVAKINRAMEEKLEPANIICIAEPVYGTIT